MSRNKELPVQFLSECFSYYPDTGALIWRKRPEHHFASTSYAERFNNRYAGTAAGSQNGAGYLHVGIGGVMHRVHRIAWALSTGEWPTVKIDHKDGDRSNNKWLNLRLADDAGNSQNCKIRIDNTSGYKGVFASSTGWRSKISARGKRYDLGRFNSPELAHEFYDLAAQMLHGQFASRR